MGCKGGEGVKVGRWGSGKVWKWEGEKVANFKISEVTNYESCCRLLTGS
jgi:hypothetical protein